MVNTEVIILWRKKCSIQPVHHIYIFKGHIVLAPKGKVKWFRKRVKMPLQFLKDKSSKLFYYQILELVSKLGNNSEYLR